MNSCFGQPNCHRACAAVCLDKIMADGAVPELKRTVEHEDELGFVLSACGRMVVYRHTGSVSGK
eukprot:SAG11_NODE_627_length_8087_cov_3.567852_4_plen_64_part_00